MKNLACLLLFVPFLSLSADTPTAVSVQNYVTNTANFVPSGAKGVGFLTVTSATATPIDLTNIKKNLPNYTFYNTDWSVSGGGRVGIGNTLYGYSIFVRPSTDGKTYTIITPNK